MGYRVKNISGDHISVEGANLAPGQSKVFEARTEMISYLAKNHTVAISVDVPQPVVVQPAIVTPMPPKGKSSKKPDLTEGDS